MNSGVASPLCQEGQSEITFQIFTYSFRFFLFCPIFSPFPRFFSFFPQFWQNFRCQGELCPLLPPCGYATDYESFTLFKLLVRYLLVLFPVHKSRKICTFTSYIGQHTQMKYFTASSAITQNIHAGTLAIIRFNFGNIYCTIYPHDILNCLVCKHKCLNNRVYI